MNAVGFRLSICAALAVAATVAIAGCQSSASGGPPDLLPPPTATVRLSVTSTSLIAGVDHLVVGVEIAGGKTPLTVPTTGAIPPLRTFELHVLYAGTATFTVEARDASGKLLAQGTAMGQTVLGQSVDVTVNLEPV
jgi:hypothetical protein